MTDQKKSEGSEGTISMKTKHGFVNITSDDMFDILMTAFCGPTEKGPMAFDPNAVVQVKERTGPMAFHPDMIMNKNKED